jgi:hypothetical protein
MFEKHNYCHSLESSRSPVSENPSCDHLSFTKRGIRETRRNAFSICYSPGLLKFTGGILNIRMSVHGIAPVMIVRIVKCRALLILSEHLERFAYNQITVPNVRKFNISTFLMVQITSRFGEIWRLFSSQQLSWTSCNWSKRPVGSLFMIFFEFQIYGSALQFFSRGAIECWTHFLSEIAICLLFLAKTLIWFVSCYNSSFSSWKDEISHLIVPQFIHCERLKSTPDMFQWFQRPPETAGSPSEQREDLSMTRQSATVIPSDQFFQSVVIKWHQRWMMERIRFVSFPGVWRKIWFSWEFQCP